MNKPEPPGGLRHACRAYVEDLHQKGGRPRPRQPLEPGRTAPELMVDPKRSESLIGLAVREAAAAVGHGRDASAVVWTDGPDELLVLLDTLEVRMADGRVTVAVQVACDELAVTTGEPAAKVAVDLVIGTRERPTGMLAAYPPPRGPQLVTDRWGDALVALAWQALLDTAAGLAAHGGADEDGAGLVPAAWTAGRDGLRVLPQARHDLDRRRVVAVRR